MINKNELEKFIRSYNQMNDERFDYVWKQSGLEWNKKTETYRFMLENSAIHFLLHAPDKLIKAMIDYADFLEITYKGINLDEDQRIWKKFLYTKEKTGDKVYSKELDLSTYKGVKECCEIHETCDRIKAILPLCDIIEKKAGNSHEKVRVYEHDLIKVTSRWDSNIKMILACVDDGHVHRPPYYVELIYTQKYGYLNPSGDPNKDRDEVKISESIFNANFKAQKNDYVIKLGTSFEVIGNVVTDCHLLEPDKVSVKAK